MNDDEVTVRQLTEEEQAELSQRVRFLPRLTREGPGVWSFMFRPTRQSTACITSALPEVLGAILPVWRAVRARERASGTDD
jgi:hypothetical protein